MWTGKRWAFLLQNLEHEHIWIEFWIMQSKVAISMVRSMFYRMIDEVKLFFFAYAVFFMLWRIVWFPSSFSIFTDRSHPIYWCQVKGHSSHSYENKNSLIRSLKDDKQHTFEFWDSFAISFMCGCFFIYLNAMGGLSCHQIFHAR